MSLYQNQKPMKEEVSTTFGSSGLELLEKARNSRLNSKPETEELQIEGSPFRAVKENEKWFAVWGSGKMTQDFDTCEELLEWIEQNYWNFMITVLTMAMDSRDLYRAAQIQKYKLGNDEEPKMGTHKHETNFIQQ